MFSVLRELLNENPYDHSPTYGVFPELFLDNSPRAHFLVSGPRRQTSVSPGSNPYTRNDPNKYQVMLNVKHFRPEEIDVKIVNDCIVIHGQHEEHADEHGFVSREFTRRYKLPEDVEPVTVKSFLSQNSVLTIQAPRKQLEPPPKNERIVPITIQQPAAVEDAQKQQQLQDQQQKSSEEQ